MFLFDIKKNGKIFKLARCKNCDHEFAFPLPSKKELKTFYDNRYEHEDVLLCTPRIRQKKETIKLIKKHFRHNIKNKKILDIGVGMGDFFRMVEEEGMDVYGIDYSKLARINGILFLRPFR